MPTGVDRVTIQVKKKQLQLKKINDLEWEIKLSGQHFDVFKTIHKGGKVSNRGDITTKKGKVIGTATFYASDSADVVTLKLDAHLVNKETLQRIGDKAKGVYVKKQVAMGTKTKGRKKTIKPPPQVEGVTWKERVIQGKHEQWETHVGGEFYFVENGQIYDDDFDELTLAKFKEIAKKHAPKKSSFNVKNTKVISVKKKPATFNVKNTKVISVKAKQRAGAETTTAHLQELPLEISKMIGKMVPIVKKKQERDKWKALGEEKQLPAEVKSKKTFSEYVQKEVPKGSLMLVDGKSKTEGKWGEKYLIMTLKAFDTFLDEKGGIYGHITLTPKEKERLRKIAATIHAGTKKDPEIWTGSAKIIEHFFRHGN